MRKIILIAHLSLDGFVAGEKGELDGFEAGEENLEFVAEISGAADAILFGRITYQLLDEYWTNARNLPNASQGQINYSNWYNSAHKLVVSKTLSGLQKEGITVLHENILNQLTEIKKKPGKAIVIFASPSVSQLLMQHNLIDSYWIFINPVIFGKGVPLFKDLTQKIKLKPAEARQFPNGELAIKFGKD